MILIVSKFLIPKGYRGLTFFPFVVLRFKSGKNDLLLLNHERIHIRQQLELLVIPFYIWYFIDFGYKLWLYKDKKLAYRNIIFEKEAYKNENDLDYLKKRSFWEFLKYI